MSVLEELGWQSFFAEQVGAEEQENLAPARVAEVGKGVCRIWSEAGELLATPGGRLWRGGGRDSLPATGDWVLVAPRPAEGRATIVRVLARKTRFSRKVAGERTGEQVVAANVETLLVVMAIDRDFSLRRLERYVALAWEGGARPAVVLNKMDLAAAPADPAEWQRRAEGAAPGVPVLALCASTGEGVGALAGLLRRGETAALVGSSGVGKSTLANRLIGGSGQRVAAIGTGTGRGRHTTTSRQLLCLPGGALLLDTPGMRELQLWEGATGLATTFEEIEALAAGCRFRDCSHGPEPGCAVRRAVAAGDLDPERLASHERLRREERFLATRQDVLLRLEEKRRHRRLTKVLRAPRW